MTVIQTVYEDKIKLQLLTNTEGAPFLIHDCKTQTRDEFLCRGRGPGDPAVPVNI